MRAPTEVRLARIETHIEHLNANVADLRSNVGELRGAVVRLDEKMDRQFLVLGGLIVSLAVGMAGLMARGFHWL